MADGLGRRGQNSHFDFLQIICANEMYKITFGRTMEGERNWMIYLIGERGDEDRRGNPALLRTGPQS